MTDGASSDADDIQWIEQKTGRFGCRVDLGGEYCHLNEQRKGTIVLDYRYADGTREKHRVGTRDRSTAVKIARKYLAARVQELLDDIISGGEGRRRKMAPERSRRVMTSRTLTVGDIANLNRAGRLRPGKISNRTGRPLDEAHRQRIRQHLRRFEAVVGGHTPVAEAGVEWWEEFRDALLAGDLRYLNDDGVELTIERGITLGTAVKAFKEIRTCFQYAVGRKGDDGTTLLTINPLAAIPLPKVKKGTRLVPTSDRIDRILEHADTADPTGRLKATVMVDRCHGRRLKALRHLKRKHILLTTDEARDRLLSMRQGDHSYTAAAHYVYGAIEWSPEHDKSGYHTLAPMGPRLRDVIVAYLELHPEIRDDREAFLFPYKGKDRCFVLSRPVTEYQLHDPYNRAEAAAREAEEKKKERGEPFVDIPPLPGSKYHGTRHLNKALLTRLRCDPWHLRYLASWSVGSDSADTVYSEVVPELLLEAAMSIEPNPEPYVSRQLMEATMAAFVTSHPKEDLVEMLQRLSGIAVPWSM